MTKILFTGGVTGGHFYPIIAVAQSIHDIVREEKLLNPKLYFFGPEKYDERALFEQEIQFKQIPTGKLRLQFSIKNILDMFKVGFGVIKAIWEVFKVYPDVVFAKGGSGSFPTLMAARILRIPVVIHESDSVPGRVNLWAGKFAQAIAISYPEVSNQFPDGKTAHTGNPIRKELVHPEREGAHEFLKLEKDVPVILILGGSQGAQRVNDTILRSLPRLVEKYQVIHQVGDKNITSVTQLADMELKSSKHKDRYKPFPFLNVLAMRMSAGVADIIITRAGSTIFEIALWGIPSIIVPIPPQTSRDQRSNAFAYAHSGAAVVIEEANFDDDILISQLDRILGSSDKLDSMSKAAKGFARDDASRKIAMKVLEIALEHEK